jgi:trehalose/maltose hydrolase-like predicted phosphorylase
MMTLFGFAGLSLLDDGIALAPRLPRGWTSLGFPLQWRGRHIRIRIGPDNLLEAALEAGQAMTLAVDGQRHDLRPDQPLRISTHTTRRSP